MSNPHHWTADLKVVTDDAGTIMDAFVAFAKALEEAQVRSYEITLTDSGGVDVLELTRLEDDEPEPTTPVLVPLTYWSNGNGIVHQIRRVSYVHDPKNAEPSLGTRTLCGQQIAYLHPSFLGESKSCQVCEGGGANEIALIHSGLGTRWRLP